MVMPYQVQPQQIAAVPATTTAAQLDISTLLAAIMPLIMIVLVMQMLKPLMKGMSGD